MFTLKGAVFTNTELHITKKIYQIYQIYQPHLEEYCSLRREIPFSKACRLVTLALIAPTSPGCQFYKELVGDPLVNLTATLCKQTWLSGHND